MSYRIPMTALRMVKERTVTLPHGRIIGATHAAAIATALIGNRPVEHMIAIMLDGQGNVTSVSTVSIGGMHGTAVAPRDVLRAALASHAAAFILAHNHPSGDPTPSKEDLVFTAAIAAAAEVIGLPMLDHVVVTRSGSFRSVQT